MGSRLLVSLLYDRCFRLKGSRVGRDYTALVDNLLTLWSGDDFNELVEFIASNTDKKAQNTKSVNHFYNCDFGKCWQHC